MYINHGCLRRTGGGREVRDHGTIIQLVISAVTQGLGCVGISSVLFAHFFFSRILKDCKFSFFPVCLLVGNTSIFGATAGLEVLYNTQLQTRVLQVLRCSIFVGLS